MVHVDDIAMTFTDERLFKDNCFQVNHRQFDLLAPLLVEQMSQFQVYILHVGMTSEQRAYGIRIRTVVGRQHMGRPLLPLRSFLKERMVKSFVKGRWLHLLCGVSFQTMQLIFSFF
jgi:hypothetical protein